MERTRCKTWTEPNPRPHFASPPSSIIRRSPRSVDLCDWWLIKIDGDGLGVEGFASRLNLGVGIFKSTAISTRRCTNILETNDGVTVRITGLINVARTNQNGFPVKVCSKFMHGFPYNWEDYATRSRDKESTSVSDEPNIFSEHFANDSSPSFNDLPATTINSLLLSTLGHASYDLILKKICNNLERTCSEHSGASEDRKENDECSVGEKSVDARIVKRKAKSRTRSEHFEDPNLVGEKYVANATPVKKNDKCSVGEKPVTSVTRIVKRKAKSRRRSEHSEHSEGHATPVKEANATPVKKKGNSGNRKQASTCRRITRSMSGRKPRKIPKIS